jgi:hypothetical protein
MTPTLDSVLAEVRALVRSEHRPALEAALEWGLPKCRTDEERLLYPSLLLVLGNLNALVTFRRLEPGDRVDFHVAVSHARPDGPPARTHLILQVAAAPRATPAAGELWLSADAIRAEPLACAARALARLLAQDPSS